MGQAKARGTKDQRIIEGEQKARDKETARKQAAAEREALMTPEEKAKRKKAQLLLAGMLAMVGSDLGLTKAVNMLRR